MDFQQKNRLALRKCKFVFRKHTAQVSLQDKKKEKIFIVLSTMHSSPDIDVETGQTAIVTEYNKTKGGVNATDQMAHCSTVKRKSKRWPLVIFLNILDLSSIAARDIWKLKFPDKTLSQKDNTSQCNLNAARQMCIVQIRRRLFV